MVSIYTTVNQHLNKWAHGKTAPSLPVVLAVGSNNRNLGWRFLPVQGESKVLVIQKQERPLQSERALGSCRQLSGCRQRAMWEASKRPSSEPVRCCRQTSAWRLTAQCPAAATHILRVLRGGWGSHSAAKGVWEEGRSDITVRLPAIGGGGCKAVALSHAYTTRTRVLMSQIAF